MATTTNSRPPVRIRTATPDDMDAMIPVVNAAFGFESFSLGGTRTDPRQMREMMEKGDLLLAEDDRGRVVACVYIELRRERGYFGMLSVEPSRQGSGLGRAMVEAAEDYCRERDCRWIDLIVLSLRRQLLPFYHKLGYVETRTEEFRPARLLKEGVECFGIILSKAL